MTSNTVSRNTLSDKGTRFVVTINTKESDPEGDELRDSILSIEEMYKEGRLLYAIGSYERGDNDGRLHLQCWLYAKTQMRVGYVTSQIPQAWACVQSSRDDDKAALYACDPEKPSFIEKAFEFGERPSKGAGRRTDLETVNALIATGKLRSIRAVNDHNPGVLARYPNWASYRLEEAVRDEVFEIHRGASRPQDLVWQHWLRRYVTELPPDLRKVIFVVGKRGGEGKSSFLRTLRVDLQDDAQLLRPGKKSDMAQALQSRCRVLSVDIARGQSEHISHLYSFLEECKDGEVFNPKYQSRMIPLTPCHVIVTMNVDVNTGQGGHYPGNAFQGEPDLTVRNVPPLSYDRYLIWDLADEYMMDTWHPDHDVYGDRCPPFQSFDSDFQSVPYNAPFIPSSGPEFNGDIAGDGPFNVLFMGESQDTHPRAGVRTDFIMVGIRFETTCDPLMHRDRVYQPLDRSRVPCWPGTIVEEEWLDLMDLSPSYYEEVPDAEYEVLVRSPSIPQFNVNGSILVEKFYLSHFDDLPEEVLYQLDYDTDTDTMVFVTVYVDPFKLAMERAIFEAAHRRVSIIAEAA